MEQPDVAPADASRGLLDPLRTAQAALAGNGRGRISELASPLPSGGEARYRCGMSRLAASKRARMPASAFAYVDSRGRPRLPIHDQSHVRNALAPFSRVGFENDAARERTRTPVLYSGR